MEYLWGSRFKGNSPIHQLNGLSKLFSFGCFTVGSLVVKDFTYLLAFIGLFFVLFFMSNLGGNDFNKLIKRFWFFALITFLVHIIFPPGGEMMRARVLYGCKNGIFFTLRLFLLFAFPFILLETTSFEELRATIEKVSGFLARISSFFTDLNIIIILSLRFIFWIGQEIEEIREAQLARGINWKRKGLISKIKGVIPIFVPTFISTMRKAERVAKALQIRGYNPGARRSSMYEMSFRLNDIVFAVFSFFILFMSIYTRLIG
ncbi:MAG: energy-coupling factor transporter transmembrane component T family protein [bacterium]